MRGKEKARRAFRPLQPCRRSVEGLRQALSCGLGPRPPPGAGTGLSGLLPQGGPRARGTRAPQPGERRRAPTAPGARGRGGRQTSAPGRGAPGPFPAPGRAAPRFSRAILSLICCIVCINMNILFCLFCLLGANKAVSFFFTPNAALRAINQWVVFG